MNYFNFFHTHCKAQLLLSLPSASLLHVKWILTFWGEEQSWWSYSVSPQEVRHLQQFVVKLPAEVGLGPGWSPPWRVWPEFPAVCCGWGSYSGGLGWGSGWGDKGVGFVLLRLSTPRCCAWGHPSSFFSASQNILLFILIKLGDAQAGWDQTLSWVKFMRGGRGVKNGIFRFSCAPDLHRFKSI